MSGVWARLGGVSVVPTDSFDLEQRPGLRQAYADGIERGFEGDLPKLPEAIERYLLRARSSDVGLLALLRDRPTAGDTSVLAIAVDPEWRGNAFATKALLAVERRLLRGDTGRLVVRVPRTNGRGLYFMLRAGFTPLAGTPGDDASWFARGGSR